MTFTIRSKSAILSLPIFAFKTSSLDFLESELMTIETFGLILQLQKVANHPALDHRYLKALASMTQLA